MEHTSPVPVVVALVVAIIGSIVLYNMDFVHHTVVRNDGILKISREALARAGANAAPTPAGPIEALRPSEGEFSSVMSGDAGKGMVDRASKNGANRHNGALPKLETAANER